MPITDNRAMSADAHARSRVHPYEALTPDVVQDALAALGLACDGRLQALSSYENRVYQAGLDDGSSVITKFYRPGRWSQAQILEEHAFAAELQAHEVPVVAPLILQGASLHECSVVPDRERAEVLVAPPSDKPVHGQDQGRGDAPGTVPDGEPVRFYFSVSPRRGGRAPELEDAEVLEWIGRFLARLHNVGARQPFAHRPALDAQRLGAEPLQWLLASGMIPLDVQSEWQRACADALALVDQHFTLAMPHIQSIRLHGDCHAGNVLWTPVDAPAAAGPGPHFVDLDDACMGPAVQDLWMLLSGERAQRTWQLGCLLDGYEQMRDFDRRELALIEPLRTLRLIHYSAWLARRWADPTFPRNFPWFGSSDYWLGLAHQMHEQIEAMQEEPLVV
jgi:Ser/Thr protein kinase RdoA (MazF antagonist)